MRDGIPIIALIISCIALLVAALGALSPSGSEGRGAPEEMLQDAIRKLDSLEQKRKSRRQEIAKLSDDIIEIKEASAGARGEAYDKTEIQNVVRKTVERELSNRIKKEAALLGAKAGGQPAPPQGGARPPASKAGARRPTPGKPVQAKPSPQAVAFNKMHDSMCAALGLDATRKTATKQALSELRGELNRIFTNARANKIDTATRDKLAAAARKRADDRVAKVLSAAQLAKYKSWKSSADAYTKRFFGLTPAP